MHALRRPGACGRVSDRVRRHARVARSVVACMHAARAHRSAGGTAAMAFHISYAGLKVAGSSGRSSSITLMSPAAASTSSSTWRRSKCTVEVRVRPDSCCGWCLPLLLSAGAQTAPDAFGRGAAGRRRCCKTLLLSAERAHMLVRVLLKVGRDVVGAQQQPQLLLVERLRCDATTSPPGAPAAWAAAAAALGNWRLHKGRCRVSACAPGAHLLQAAAAAAARVAQRACSLCTRSHTVQPARCGNHAPAKHHPRRNHIDAPTTPASSQ